ncbi:hypothetical protein [Streptomyces sp. A5-4]
MTSTPLAKACSTQGAPTTSARWKSPTAPGRRIAQLTDPFGNVIGIDEL